MMNDGHSSKTAKLVARSLLLSSHDRMLRRLLPEDAGEIMISMPAVSGGAFGTMRRFVVFRTLCKFIESIALPGISAHYLARKAWIERETRSALASGVRSVVVIGAGFDTLASRLSSEFADVGFFEIDHPATQQEKTASLPVRNNLHFVAGDLEHDTPVELMRKTFGVREPAVVIAEGVTMYLPQAHVVRLLRDAASLAGSEGRVLFSFMEKRGNGSIGFQGQSPWVRRWLDLCGESFRWGLAREQLEAFLVECRLRPSMTVGCSVMRKTILQPLDLQDLRLAEGEWLCLAHPIRS